MKRLRPQENEMIRLQPGQIEELAKEIRRFLLKIGMWQDVDIYFNGKCFTQYDPESDMFYYNDRRHLVVVDGKDPRDYFEYVNPDHILSMSFEGPLYSVLNYNHIPEVRRGFDAIFEKYGLYYEQGDAWNLTCYYIAG